MSRTPIFPATVGLRATCGRLRASSRKKMGIASGIETLELIDLTPFAVEARYDIESWPERVEAEAAVAIAARVCAAVARIVAWPG